MSAKPTTNNATNTGVVVDVSLEERRNPIRTIGGVDGDVLRRDGVERYVAQEFDRGCPQALRRSQTQAENGSQASQAEGRLSQGISVSVGFGFECGGIDRIRPDRIGPVS